MVLLNLFSATHETSSNFSQMQINFEKSISFEASNRIRDAAYEDFVLKASIAKNCLLKKRPSKNMEAALKRFDEVSKIMFNQFIAQFESHEALEYRVRAYVTFSRIDEIITKAQDQRASALEQWRKDHPNQSDEIATQYANNVMVLSRIR